MALAKKGGCLAAIAIVAWLAWLAAGRSPSPPLGGTRSVAATSASPTSPPARVSIPNSAPPPPPTVTVQATDTSAPAVVPVIATPTVMADADSAQPPRPLIIPVRGYNPASLRDMFNEVRGARRHEAIDLLAPRGTPVIAAGDGVVKKLFTSVPGGLTIYEFDPDQRYCYYYAHLDAYAAGLHEGQALHQGDVIGYVGTTGNAPKDTPHLHFALIRLDADHRWWKGTYVDPYPVLARNR